MSDQPLILQSDLTIVLETTHPRFEEMRDGLLPFAELVKSPEFLHTYRVSPVSVWNASATGLSANKVLEFLTSNARYGVPSNFEVELRSWFERCGVFTLVRDEPRLRLETNNPAVLSQLIHDPELADLLEDVNEVKGLSWLQPAHRGLVKERLVRLGYPADDRAGYVTGTPLEIQIRKKCLQGPDFELRPYQEEAIQAFHKGGSDLGRFRNCGLALRCWQNRSGDCSYGGCRCRNTGVDS